MTDLSSKIKLYLIILLYFFLLVMIVVVVFIKCSFSDYLGILRNGPIKGWKMQDVYSKLLIFIFIAILTYKPVVNIIGRFS